MINSPLPFSIPGTFLKTLPETENHAKTVFWSISSALAGELRKFNRRVSSDFCFWTSELLGNRPLPLFSWNAPQRCFEAGYVGIRKRAMYRSYYVEACVSRTTCASRTAYVSRTVCARRTHYASKPAWGALAEQLDELVSRTA